MFARLPEAHGAAVAVTIDGAPFEARTGDTVAAALLAAGVTAFRTTPVSGAPRAAFCMMGICFDCVVAIDGRAGERSCVVPVAPGMQIVTVHRPGPTKGSR